MIVRFTWRAREWREAHLLATTEQDPRSGPVPMGLLILGFMALGGAGDLLRAMGHNRTTVLHDSLAPMLMLVCTLSGLVAVTFYLLHRREQLREMPVIPQGEQQMTVHELGWNVGSLSETPRPRLVRAWSELRGKRTGRYVLSLLTHDGSTVGVPLRVLTPDQGGWLERLLQRKVPQGA